MNIDFNNKNILVTGTNSNLGKKMIELFLENNAIVHATVTNKKKDDQKNIKNLHYYELDFNKS